MMPPVDSCQHAGSRCGSPVAVGRSPVEHRPAVDAGALVVHPVANTPLQPVGHDAHAHAGAVEPELRAHGVGVQDGVAFGQRTLPARRARIGRQANRIDDGELRDGLEAATGRCACTRRPRGVANLDRHAAGR